jgi:hypothetical protein
MEVRGDSATQYGESEMGITSFSIKTGDKTLQYSGDGSGTSAKINSCMIYKCKIEK